jgi:hypothetical protein
MNNWEIKGSRLEKAIHLQEILNNLDKIYDEEILIYKNYLKSYFAELENIVEHKGDINNYMNLNKKYLMPTTNYLVRNQGFITVSECIMFIGVGLMTDSILYFAGIYNIFLPIFISASIIISTIRRVYKKKNGKFIGFKS